jgi:hypothetical protein
VAVKPLRLAALLLAVTACGSEMPTLPQASAPPPTPVIPVIAAAGDISCAPNSRAACRQMDTALAVEYAAPDVVLPLGDTQYEAGESLNFARMYTPSWGRFKPITRPVVGNHEYQTPGAQGYFDYFNGVNQINGPAGDRRRGYYSYHLGAWNVIALNSNCREVGGCHLGSPQELFLRQALANSDATCTLAYFHHPLFSSGVNRGSPDLRPLWQTLYDFRADLVLNAHEHLYERFEPQTPQGVPDPERGILQITVGTGGHSLTPFREILRTSDVRNNDDFGVLRLELHPGHVTWEFIPVPGGTFNDSGSRRCR